MQTSGDSHRAVRITLCAALYKRDAIEAALTAYHEVCEGRILDDAFTIELLPKQGTEPLAPEFCNYVLGLMR